MTTIMKILDNGPLFVNGEVEMSDALGNRFTLGKQFTLCRCGLSDKKPFCDGSHRPKGFTDAPRAEEPAA
jgi:CDGSH-type Zn-finger protein